MPSERSVQGRNFGGPSLTFETETADAFFEENARLSTLCSSSAAVALPKPPDAVQT